MRKVLIFLLAGAFVVLGMGAGGAAKEKKEKPAATSEVRWHGSIVRSNKDLSTLDVRKGQITKTIHYDSSTKWTKGTSTIDPGQVKDGDQVICLGKYDEKNEFHATRIDLRAGGLFHIH